jgi:nucleoside-triphosphatase THEP1
MTASPREIFRQAYQNFDLSPLVTAEAIDAFRVDYGLDTIARLEQVVDDAPRNGKVVFAGHRGCGKSTLLARFAKGMMQQGYFVASFSISDMVDMSAVDHVNILYSIAIQLLSKATERQVPIPEKTKQEVLGWFNTSRTTTQSAAATLEAGVGGDILKFLTAKLKTESSFREEIKRTYERQISVLVKQIDLIARCIREATKKEVLVVIDDLDKLEWRLVEDIYQNNLNALFEPDLKVVFTIPVAVIREQGLRTMLQTACDGVPIQQMEVMKFFTKKDRNLENPVPDAAKVNLLLKAIDKRLSSDHVAPGTAEKMVLKSGGVLRELVRIVRACCGECSLLLRMEPDRTDVMINDEILEKALMILRNEFQASMGTKRKDILAYTYREAAPPEIDDADFLDLLHSLYILEYRNDGVWYGLHPIVADILRRDQVLV